MVDAERSLLLDKLGGISEDDWSRESLSAPWTVSDVVGHITAISTMSAPKFVKGMASNGFNFERFQAAGIEANTEGKTPAQQLERLRSLAKSRGKPPGPKMTVLGEFLVHSEDINRALSESFAEHPEEAVVAVADFYKRNSFPLKVKARIAGVTLRMTDGEWSYGSGPEVSGPGIAIVMAMVGRSIALKSLNGEGVSVLQSR
jgi:uncharacterized protein (TIGR03083 family)